MAKNITTAPELKSLGGWVIHVLRGVYKSVLTGNYTNLPRIPKLHLLDMLSTFKLMICMDCTRKEEAHIIFFPLNFCGTVVGWFKKGHQVYWDREFEKVFQIASVAKEDYKGRWEVSSNANISWIKRNPSSFFFRWPS